MYRLSSLPARRSPVRRLKQEIAQLIELPHVHLASESLALALVVARAAHLIVLAAHDVRATRGVLAAFAVSAAALAPAAPVKALALPALTKMARPRPFVAAK